MIVFLLALLVLIYGIYSFISGNHVKSLIAYTFFLTNGFQMIPESYLAGFPLSKFSDFGLMYIVTICLLGWISDKNFFSLKDTMSKFIAILMVYMTFELISTVISAREGFGQAFKVYRQFFSFGLFFIIRQVQSRDLDIFMRFLFKVVLTMVILFVLQAILRIQILTGTIDGLSGDGGITRFRNFPLLLDFFLLSVLFIPFKNRYKLLIISVFLAGFILPMNRGQMLALVIVVAAYFLMTKKFGPFLKYSLLFVCFGLIAWPFISYRFEEKSSGPSVEDIIRTNDFSDYNASEGSTFAFRMALLTERVNFLIDHPRFFLTGVGMQHEDSPKTQKDYDFFVGATKIDETGKPTKQQIDTTDLVWATMLLRYGLVGVAIYVSMFIYLMMFFFRNRLLPISLVSFLMISMYMVNSFAIIMLVLPTTFFMIFLAYNYICRRGSFIE